MSGERACRSSTTEICCVETNQVSTERVNFVKRFSLCPRATMISRVGKTQRKMLYAENQKLWPRNFLHPEAWEKSKHV